VTHPTTLTGVGPHSNVSYQGVFREENPERSDNAGILSFSVIVTPVLARLR
jgi:hypothetical protein